VAEQQEIHHLFHPHKAIMVEVELDQLMELVAVVEEHLL
tara:strand:- start:389 stop:505 length:117 start_codon:yes stop_codon:yes gene_type:complete